MDITAGECSALLDLQSHWEGAFMITVEPGCWRATSIETLEVLTADTDFELREKMRDYYAELKARS